MQKKGNTISAVMIVRDEAHNIARAISSVHDWVDEVIVVDTGSTDNTIETAKTFHKVKVYEYEWNDSFSDARNYAFTKCTKEWWFVIDADEEVVSGHGEQLKMVLPITRSDAISVVVSNVYRDVMTGVPVERGILPSMRCFHKDSGIKYVGNVHNKPTLPDENKKLEIVALRIKHYGYDQPPDIMEKKFLRTVSMCESWCEREPDNPEAKIHLARALKIRGGALNIPDLPRIISLLNDAIKIIGDDLSTGANLAMATKAYDMLAWMYHLSRKYDDAIYNAMMALELTPKFIDSMLILGLSYTNKDIRIAEYWLLEYLKTQQEFVNGHLRLAGSLSVEHINDRELAIGVLLNISKIKAEKGILTIAEKAEKKEKSENG